jgi:small-conductance mechanosensitive channel
MCDTMWDYIKFFIVSSFLAIFTLGIAQSWIRRFFTWLKMREDNYLSPDAIDSAHAYLRLILVGLFIVSILITARLFLTDFSDIIVPASNYIFLFNAFLTFSVFAILAILSSSAIANHRKHETAEDKNAVIKPGMMEFYELFLKYGMLIMGLAVAIMVGLISIPDDAIRQEVYTTLNLDSLQSATVGTEMVFLIIVLLGLFVMSKFLDIILDDFKGRSKKFQPGIIDLMKAAVKYSIYWLAFITTVSVFLEIIDHTIAMYVIAFIMALTITGIIILGVSPAFKNAMAGIILLVTDSINKGDWVRIGNENVGEVVAQGLVITSIKTKTGDTIDLPNETILKTYIHNYTKLGGTMVRISMDLKTTMTHEKIEELLLATAQELDESTQITSERAVLNVAITSLKTDTVEYTIGIWRKDPVTMESTVSTFLKRFHVVAVKNNITVVSTNVKI